MPNIKSAEKRLKQDAKKNLTNKVKKSQMRTYVRKLRDACEAGDKSQAETLLPIVYKKIDKAAKTNCIHANAAARKKSQVLKLVQALG